MLANRGQDIEQIACRACQPIEPCHHQHIAPGSSLRINLANSARSVFAPETFSLKTFELNDTFIDGLQRIYQRAQGEDLPNEQGQKRPVRDVEMWPIATPFF